VKHSTKLSGELLKRFHHRIQVGPIVTYPPRDGMKDEAARNWVNTGVCSSCHCRAISLGQCKCCGYEPGKE
jgi:hypothetical protein